VLELLESRHLFSVTLTHTGTLLIVGSNKDDAVVLSAAETRFS
jgi:hypothetical protein